jgi:uncharacterized iron-regulated protein
MRPNRRQFALTVTVTALLLGGCATAPDSPAAAARTELARRAAGWQAGPGQVLLLGETHDNAVQHALRAQALAALLARGDRPALLMEQLDRERQAAIDQAAQRADGTLDERVQAVLDASGPVPGWHWPFYRPYLRLALQYGLPIVAANVSRAEARRIVQQGLAAGGWRSDVPEDIARAQTEAIAASHCGQVDAALAARLSQAQVARDQFMARQIAAHAARGVVLLAGNGHVRRDIGVPRWLPAALRERSHVVGFLEADDDDDAAFDEVVRTPAQTREDPCAGMRRLPARLQTASAPASR